MDAHDEALNETDSYKAANDLNIQGGISIYQRTGNNSFYMDKSPNIIKVDLGNDVQMRNGSPSRFKSRAHSIDNAGELKSSRVNRNNNNLSVDTHQGKGLSAYKEIRKNRKMQKIEDYRRQSVSPGFDNALILENLSD